MAFYLLRAQRDRFSPQHPAAPLKRARGSTRRHVAMLSAAGSADSGRPLLSQIVALDLEVSDFLAHRVGVADLDDRRLGRVGVPHDSDADRAIEEPRRVEIRLVFAVADHRAFDNKVPTLPAAHQRPLFLHPPSH
eukprot:Amastigsp_a3374_6.p3 type:complete len:135 gc:universal Amastigsp_a3374_6:1127-723(-)